MYSNEVRQNSQKDFNSIMNLLANKTPFTFIRFSDGEMEVIRNQPFRIGNGQVSWRKGDFSYKYPDFDEKEFSPERDFRLRNELIDSATYSHPQFIKGIPALHNNARDDQNLMIKLNGHSMTNLTFSDLFLNQNFKKFSYNFFRFQDKGFFYCTFLKFEYFERKGEIAICSFPKSKSLLCSFEKSSESELLGSFFKNDLN